MYILNINILCLKIAVLVYIDWKRTAQVILRRYTTLYKFKYTSSKAYDQCWQSVSYTVIYGHTFVVVSHSVGVRNLHAWWIKIFGFGLSWIQICSLLILLKLYLLCQCGAHGQVSHKGLYKVLHLLDVIFSIWSCEIEFNIIVYIIEC